MQQRSELRRLFKASRDSAGSRALMSMMRELGYQIGRFKVRNLMKPLWHPSNRALIAIKSLGLNDRTFPICWPTNLMSSNPIRCGVAISPTSGQVVVGITWQRCLTCTPGGSWAGRCQINQMQSWPSKHWRWPIRSGVAHPECCFTLTRAANMVAGHFGNDCGVIA